MGLAAQPLNQPIECADRKRNSAGRTRSDLRSARLAHAPDWQATFVFRLGYAERPRCLRRAGPMCASKTPRRFCDTSDDAGAAKAAAGRPHSPGGTRNVACQSGAWARRASAGPKRVPSCRVAHCVRAFDRLVQRLRGKPIVVAAKMQALQARPAAMALPISSRSRTEEDAEAGAFAAHRASYRASSDQQFVRPGRA